MLDQEELLKEIKLLSDSIRQKTRNLKSGVTERERYLETTFRPIVTPLKEISKKLEKTSAPTPKEILPIEIEEVTNGTPNLSEVIVDTGLRNTNAEQEEDEDNDGVEGEKKYDESVTSEDESLPKSDEDIAKKGIRSRKYLTNMMMHGAPVKKKNHVYGARVGKEGLMIGNSALTTDHEDNIIVNGKTYEGTQGLFELIFKTSPKKYTPSDLKTFKNILKSTNAHKKGYISSSSVYRNKSKKYTSIISKLFPPRKSKSGSGMALKNLYQTNVIYYNDINKLVNRMKLLHEAKEAGHTGLDNEIVALTDELRTRGYIN